VRNRSGKVRVAHLTTVHGPLDVRIFGKMCCTLAANGYDTLLIARHERAETRNGVRFVPLAQRTCGSRLARFVLSITDGGAAALRSGAGLIHFHDPELIPAALFLRMMGRRVIYDVHEDLPRQTLAKDYIPRYLRHFVAGACAVIERVAAWGVSGVAVATPAIARRFPPGKTALVQNFPALNELTLKDGPAYARRAENFAYVGGIEIIRGVREMIEAVGLVKGETTRLMLAGEFPPKVLLGSLEALDGWKRTQFLGWQSRSQVAALLANCRAGLVLLHPTSNYVESQPIKLFEYMSAGLPTIASDFPLWRTIIKEADCGILVDPLNPMEISQAMQWILDHPGEAEAMGANGQRSVKEKYNWERESSNLLALYEQVLGGASDRQ
jgi:glycosyltransferase involved in cell wall biosynthesis